MNCAKPVTEHRETIEPEEVNSIFKVQRNWCRNEFVFDEFMGKTVYIRRGKYRRE